MILAFDSSTTRTSIAIGASEADKPIAAFSEQTGGANQASTWLHERIADVVKQAGAAMQDVSLVAVGRGPGMFTGARVAAATAKGLCLGLGCPALPVSTLAAIGSAVGAKRVVALIDARRGEVYSLTLEADAEGRLHPSGDEACEPVEATLSRALAPATVAPTHLVGPGVSPYRERIEAWRAAQPGHLGGTLEIPASVDGGDGVSVAGLWAAARTAAAAGRAIPADALSVHYLRESYAEMGLNVPKRPVTRSPFLDS